MITDKEKELARFCISYAVSHGADAARASLSKSILDGCTLLNGELDKVTHSADRSIYIYLFADGKYGTFSTNRLEKAELEDFISKAITMVRMLGEDRCRSLPEKERTATDAVSGRELDLYDDGYGSSDSSARIAKAQRLSIFKKVDNNGYRLISEECEYSESMEDNFLVDSQGFEGRHTETAFSCFIEMTVEAQDGNRYSGFRWDATQKEADLDIEECARKALEKAIMQIGPKKRRSGRYRMVVDASVASKLVAPLLAALNASSIQQKMSFLEGTVGKKVFSEGFTMMDLPRTKGRNGSRLFDTEGVSTKEAPIIEGGIVRQYFVNTYMSRKMGMAPTVEDVSRPCVMPYMKSKDLSSGEKDVSLEDILRYCSNGILVTGFNGGNCNPVTGDFSFGIEGFAFSKGKRIHPVKEMLITGNMTELWNNFIAAGSDARTSARWQIPSIAFDDVSFSA